MGAVRPHGRGLPEGERGVAKIDHFGITTVEMLATIAKYGEDFISVGRYAKLKVNGELMMTDSPMEKRTNLEVVQRATGRVLIAGLGLGMILRAIIKKPEVTHITVLEKYQDVVDLVMPQFASAVAEARLEVIAADVFQWEPHPAPPKFHTIYFDIWPKSTLANLPEIHLLHKRYRPLVAKGGWMDSWTYKTLVERERDGKHFVKGLPALLERGSKKYTNKEVLAARLRGLMLGLDSDWRGSKLKEQGKQIIRQFAATKGIVL